MVEYIAEGWSAQIFLEKYQISCPHFRLFHQRYDRGYGMKKKFGVSCPVSSAMIMTDCMHKEYYFPICYCFYKQLKC
jgi:hypothetical protein